MLLNLNYSLDWGQIDLHFIERHLNEGFLFTQDVTS